MKTKVKTLDQKGTFPFQYQHILKKITKTMHEEHGHQKQERYCQTDKLTVYLYMTGGI